MDRFSKTKPPESISAKPTNNQPTTNNQLPTLCHSQKKANYQVPTYVALNIAKVKKTRKGHATSQQQCSRKQTFD